MFAHLDFEFQNKGTNCLAGVPINNGMVFLKPVNSLQNVGRVDMEPINRGVVPTSEFVLTRRGEKILDLVQKDFGV